MSYILDALKKSDQERQQNAGPSLQTTQRPHVISKRSTAFNLTVVAVVALICLSATVSWYFYTASPGKPHVKADESQALPDAGLKKATPGTAESEPYGNGAVVGSSGYSQPKSAAVPEPEPSLPAVLQYWELPDPVQKAIPAMTFSFHVYSDNPARRTIIINNRRMRQGSQVSEGLMLEEITQEGVIFNWQQQHRFSINVVENW